MRPHDTTSCQSKLAPQYPTMPRMCRTIPQRQFSKVHVNKTSTNQSHGRLRFIGATAPARNSKCTVTDHVRVHVEPFEPNSLTSATNERFKSTVKHMHFLLLVTVTVETDHQSAQWPLHTTEREMQTNRSPPVVTHATAHSDEVSAKSPNNNGTFTTKVKPIMTRQLTTVNQSHWS